MNLSLVYHQPDIDLVKKHYQDGKLNLIWPILVQYNVVSCKSCDHTNYELSQSIEYYINNLEERTRNWYEGPKQTNS